MGGRLTKQQTAREAIKDARGRSSSARPANDGQLTLAFDHIPALSADDFLVTPGNALAFEHIRAFPDWSGPLTLITGSAKSGKSHLGRIWCELANGTVAEAGALEDHSRQGGDAPLLLEDVDRAGYPEAALFHLLNQSMRDRRPLLMTARSGVGDWPFKTADVLSRARLAARFALEDPDDIQLSQMFVKLFGDRQISIDPKVITYLVTRMERSAQAVGQLVEIMDGLALVRRGPITRAIAAEALEKYEKEKAEHAAQEENYG